MLNLAANLAYGVNDNFTIGIALPYSERTDIREAHNDMGEGETELAGNSRGLSDMTLFGQYRFFSQDSFHLAVLAGLKTPMGKTSERGLEGGRFEAEQQPGSGAWDPFIGIAGDRSWGKSGVSGNIL